MKKHSFLRICVFLVTFYGFAITGFPHSLTTPRGSTVSHSHPGYTDGWWDRPEPGSLFDYEYDEEDDYVLRSEWNTWCQDKWGAYLDSSNSAYNCHAYAWAEARENDSNTWCWIDYGDASIFWTDGSYSEVDSAYRDFATHIVYGMDHSMVVTTYPNCINV